ncbi:hypothetical protein Cgig2_005684 [Carnegiea gigantea]|uniref:Uncharacterized protein n=1 Tax=Carnegiea gigantea TaxID=171969 RepID=A0A9Q1KHV8_9CARY|nr:hypothetical protein Cgig2_005684 [Carnegiea gigantea]
MSYSATAWMVAASLATVEALNDRGFIRWIYTVRNLHQHAKNNSRSYAQVKKLSTSILDFVPNKIRDVEEKQSKESLKKVMHLKCWGSNSGLHFFERVELLMPILHAVYELATSINDDQKKNLQQTWSTEQRNISNRSFCYVLQARSLCSLPWTLVSIPVYSAKPR